jgi:drug/metabolite transporter (DMT)-like permease
LRIWIFAALALIGFAANSLLCRAALRPPLIDFASFTAIRIGSGALMLAVLARGRIGGDWASASALFVYAAGFSLAYRQMSAGVGAFLLFGAVQATMIGWGLVMGEKPRALEWFGLVVALGGLGLLGLPSASAPPIGATLLMLVAGLAWGIYSLRGRGNRAPLASTAGNFVRAVPMVAAFLLLGMTALVHVSPAYQLTPLGITLAICSGALASGVGYSLWYAALPSMSATRAAILQLSVPALAAAAAIVLLGEPLVPRLVVAGAVILGGVALAVLSRGRPGSRTS